MSSSAPARTEQEWLDLVRAQILRSGPASAASALADALRAFPGSFELRRILAGIHSQTRQPAEAETLLRELLQERPGDAASALAFARLLLEQARASDVARVARDFFAESPRDPECAIRIIELLDEADRKADAAAIAEQAIALTPADSRLHAYAGMLQLQLGDFELARDHYSRVMRDSAQACEWGAPLGLASAQRYTDSTHPDFGLFLTSLQREDLSDKARSALLFGLGKAHDDVGDYARAAACFREANSLAQAIAGWSRKDWRRAVEARLAAPVIPHPADGYADFIPVFIVGMPRSGTTLLAELLARHPRVCNRGELPWIAKSAQSPDLAGTPNRTALEHHAARYRVRAMQDDAGDSRWFIDKQPLNFRYVDLMLAMFPNAKIIHCRRNPRDTALSLWMQSFNEPLQGYACEFDAIAVVMRDCTRLMRRWRERFPESIRTVDYERLVTDTQAIVTGLSEWVGLPPAGQTARNTTSSSNAISSASLWQARQPIHRDSIGRWKHYAPYVPELARAIPEAEGTLADSSGN